MTTPLPTYEELRADGLLIDDNVSLHYWREDYLYCSGEVFRVSGALDHPDVIVEEIHYQE